MESAIHKISIQKTCRYATWGDPEKAKKLLVALHGYGHLVTYFIRKFQVLNPDDFYVIAPEGPHRFYLDQEHKKVGASWMTKEDRLTDIQDYISILDNVIASGTSQFNFEEKILLGFSQGGATASRYIAYGKEKFDAFILWATVFPPDMDPHYNVKFKSMRNYFVVGNNDEYYQEDAIANHMNKLSEYELPFTLIKFDGNHTIDQKTLLNIVV